MSNLIPVTEIDIVFISYDEPNAEQNYADLLDKCPWAKRSHGVWGSDAAHKAAAALSETDRFITVDADNIVREDFFNADRIIIGTGSENGKQIMSKVYSPMKKRVKKIIFMSPESAELTKYAANAFLATKISCINEM